MTPFEALQYLNDITGKVVGDRDTHIKIQLSINILANYIQSASAPDPEPAKED